MLILRLTITFTSTIIKMELIHIVLLAICLVAMKTGAAECETGWVAYKDELCIQVFSALLTYDEAKEYCSSQSTETSKSTLVMVKGPDLQNMLSNYTHDIFDYVWLGGKYDSASDEFKWEDGEPLTYTNWQEGYPRNVTDSDTCIELRPSNAKRQHKDDGNWANVVCQKRNLVMCQRALSWTLQDAIDEIIRVRKELQAVSSRVVPVGSIYIEYYNQPTPPTLWPNLRWEDISSFYDSLFFRTSGSKSATWGATQAECAPRIVQTEYKDDTSFTPPGKLDIPTNGWSEYGKSGAHYDQGPSGSSYHQDSLRFNTTGCEVRPMNQAIRIWKRTA